MENQAPTKNISAEEWNLHKDTITALYLGQSEGLQDSQDGTSGVKGLSLAKLADIMCNDHGFNATESQFEARLKRWKVRKNLKPEEWAPILHKLVSLPRETKSRVLVCGRVIPQKTIRRAQRYCARPPRFGDNMVVDSAFNLPTLPEHVRIELYDDNKGWTEIPSSHVTTTGQGLPLLSIQFDNIRSPQLYHIPGNNPRTSAETENTPHLAQPSPADLIMPADRRHLILDGPGLSDFDLGIYEETNGEEAMVEHTLHSPPIRIEQFPLPMDLAVFGDENDSPQNMLALGRLEGNGRAEEPLTCNIWLDQLPSKSFIMAMEMESSKLVSRNTSSSRRYVDHLGGSSRTLMIGAMGIWQRFGLSSSWQENISPLGLLRILNLKFLGKDIEFKDERTQQLLSTDDYYRLKFTQFLLTGMVNGMLDFSEIPKDFLAGVLTPDRRLNSLLSSFLQSASKHIAKIIFSKIFRSAVYNGNVEVVSYLLEISNNIIEDELLGSISFNPVEAAASLESEAGGEAIMELLLRNKLIIHMSSSDKLFKVLSDLLKPSSFCVKSSPRSRFRLAFQLLRASPAFTYHILNDYHMLGCFAELERAATQCEAMRSENVVNPSLWSHFLGVPPSQHSLFFKPKFWVDVAEYANSIDAATLLKKVVSDCATQHNRVCLSTAQYFFDPVLTKALEDGQVEAFNVILPYSSYSSTPGDSSLLSAAIQGGNYSLISFIMSHKPDINPSYGKSPSCIMTPLEACIRSNNQTILNCFIQAGIMDCLGGLREFDSLKGPLCAAVEKGRNDLVIQLLNATHDLELHSLQEALRCALGAKNEALSLTLITKGGSLFRVDPGRPKENVLTLAVQMRNAVVMRELLKTGVLAVSEQGLGAVEWMIKQLEGLKSRQLFLDLLSCHHYGSRYEEFRWFIPPTKDSNPPRSYWDGLLPLLEDDDMRPLLLESKLATVQLLTACLVLAISRQKKDRIVRELIKKGADTWNEDVIRSAGKWYPAILPLLQEQPKVILTRGWRTETLKVFINEGPSCEPAIRTLLESEMVDIHDTGKCGDEDCALTPLGVAILQGNKFPKFSYDMVVMLLGRDCDLNGIAEFNFYLDHPFLNQTALLKAIEVQNIEIVKLLLHHGAGVNNELPYFVTRTPLQKAAEMGSLEIVRLLILEHEANVNAEPSVSRGGTAIQLAAISGDCIVAAELLERGALLHKPPSKIAGRWPLEGAAEHGRFDMIHFLWTAHQNTFCTIEGENGFHDKNIRKAMRLAARNGHFGCRDLIAELSGLPVTATDLPPEPSPLHVPWPPPPGWDLDVQGGLLW
ncbi:hypothetical protein F5Y10DRAFT_287832 [Nemania abortiva]|nr:hypothetical protein F5Y10DRAFT_287832 [Nemania abortiva]